MQATLRRCIVRDFVGRHLLESFEAKDMLTSAGQFDGSADDRTPRPHVRKAFVKYLGCGMLTHGFARARCADCAHDYIVTFSCKGQGVCHSCNTQRMMENVAHLTDRAMSDLPVRRCVLSVPNQLCYFVQRDGAVLNVSCVFF